VADLDIGGVIRKVSEYRPMAGVMRKVSGYGACGGIMRSVLISPDSGCYTESFWITTYWRHYLTRQYNNCSTDFRTYGREERGHHVWGLFVLIAIA
jgi:hypothetical protein